MLKSGLGPDDAVSANAPTAAGDDVLQLDASLARDGWTIVGTILFWRITVR